MVDSILCLCICVCDYHEWSNSQGRRHKHDKAIAEWESTRKTFFAWAEEQVESQSRKSRQRINNTVENINSILRELQGNEEVRRFSVLSYLSLNRLTICTGRNSCCSPCRKVISMPNMMRLRTFIAKRIRRYETLNTFNVHA